MKPHLVIVGLGNPGKQYAATRHNAGFLAVEKIAEEFGTGEWKENPKFVARTCEARVLAAAVLLVEPSTYMNRSGECVRKIVDFYKLDPASQLLVISDDIDLPLGDVRVRMKGGPGTHNGLRSIVASVGEGFPRIRLGLGMPQGADLATWVVSSLSPDERAALDTAIAAVPDRIKAFVLERSSED